MFSQFYQVPSSPALEGMSETQLRELISKLKQNNSTLESEIVKLKSEISNSLNSQNELKSRTLDLEKELHQSRLQHKLKVSQLQKEIASLSSGTPPTEKNSSATPPLQQSKTLSVMTSTASTQSIASVSQSIGTQSMTDNSFDARPIVTQSTSTQASVTHSVESQSIATQVVTPDSQLPIANKSLPRDLATDAVPSQSNTSAEPVHPPAEHMIPDVVKADIHSQTEMDVITVEKSLKKKEEAVEKLKEDFRKEMDEKITSLRNAHKENINNLSIQIQELKAELKTSEIIKKKLEDANKTLEESLIDLQNQVEILKEEKDNTKDKFQDYEKSREENEEKIKKMKGLLIAANKKLLEYKELTGNLRNEIKEANDKKQEISGNEEELMRKMQEEKEKYEDKIEEYMKENEKQRGIITEKIKDMDNLTQEKEKIHKEFQDYKLKAQLALQQSANSNGSEGKILQLEELNSKLESQIGGLEADIIHLNDKISKLENELKESMNSNLDLNQKLSEMQTNSKERIYLLQDLENLRRDIEKLKFSHHQEIEKITKEHEDMQEKLKHQITNLILDAKTSLEDNNQKTTEYVNTTQNLKAELAQARNQIEQLKTNVVPVPLNTSRPSSPFIEKQSGIHSPPLRRSSSNVLSNLDSGGVSSFKVKELTHKIDQLSLLLTESEANVERLLEQEKFLKEQLRSQDRIDVLEKRLSIEYLKNIVLSFFEAKSKESLIPVLARVLELSPEEEQKLRKTTGSTFSFM